MAFPSDARNHYKAIQSEINLNTFNTQIESIFGKKVMNYIHLGGTKNKTDVKINFIDGSSENITLKSKKNIKSGSFDWVNTTCFSKELFKNSFNVFELYKGSKNIKNKQKLEQSIKDELCSLSNDDITEIFIKQVYNKHNKDNLKMLIIDEKTSTINYVRPEIFNLIKDGFKLELVCGKGKTSFKVVCVNSKDEKIDLGLRVRLHLNNGWTKWHKGENSVLCLKFQQDSVYKMLN